MGAEQALAVGGVTNRQLGESNRSIDTTPNAHRQGEGQRPESGQAEAEPNGHPILHPDAFSKRVSVIEADEGVVGAVGGDGCEVEAIPYGYADVAGPSPLVDLVTMTKAPNAPCRPAWVTMICSFRAKMAASSGPSPATKPRSSIYLLLRLSPSNAACAIGLWR